MKCLLWMLPLLFAFNCGAQSLCKPSDLSHAAAQILALKRELALTKVDEMEEGVPPSVAEKITYLKDALSQASDAALSCAPTTISPVALQKHLAQILHANSPEPDENVVFSKDNHRYDEVLGSYGHNLRIKVSRPPDISNVVTIQYSTNIECGSDTMLLVYQLHDGAWVKKLRWQSPSLKSISDAFGDFFVFAFLHDSSGLKGVDTQWRLAVAHGRPWCTSRSSGFQVDLLAPSSDPASPQVLWHIKRGYSRGDFDPQIKAWGNTFEFRLNADCMSFDSDNCYERRVIYRYSVDDKDRVHRVGPLAINARGFVEEWISAPWQEAQELSAAESLTTLQETHEQFSPPTKPKDGEYISHSYGPVRACAAAQTFQVQMDSSLEKVVPGKPGGDSEPLASRYFHVREAKDGYLMIFAATEPDPTCSGANLMRTGNE